MSEGQTRLTRHVAISPLDVLFFRDGRAFDPGSTVSSGLPLPHTLAAAFRSHLMAQSGCDFAKLGTAIAGGATLRAALADQTETMAGIADLRLEGPWLADGDTTLLPVPANLRENKDTRGIIRLDPLKETIEGLDPDSGLLPLWHRSTARHKKLDGYLSADVLGEVLAGSTPDRDSVVSSDALYMLEPRTGIAIGPDRQTAADGMIYAAALLRLHSGVRFVATLHGLPPPLASIFEHPFTMRWGGESRHVRVEPLTQPPLASADTLPHREPERRLLYLATPAVLPRRYAGTQWRPCAAATYEAIPFSGWDLARQAPKPLRFAVPAGTVLFFDAADAVWPADTLLAEGEDRHLGFGITLTGVWNHA